MPNWRVPCYIHILLWSFCRCVEIVKAFCSLKSLVCIMHKVSYIALSFPMHFDAKDILMISIRQFGVSHVHVLLCLVEDPVGL